MSEDLRLLTAWCEGDLEAGSDLFRRHSEGIFRFFRNKVDSGAVADLVQQTFLACVESRDRYRREASFRTYLFTIARHQLFAYWRSRKRNVALDFEHSSLADLGPSPSSLIALKREQRLLLEALRRIPLDYQVVLELYYWEGFGSRELAQVLDIPANTARSRLGRARKSLHAQLTQLAESSTQLSSVVDNLETWAQSLQSAIGVS